MKKTIVLLLVLLMVLGLATGCSTSGSDVEENASEATMEEEADAETPEDKLLFGVTLLFRTDDWSVDIERSMQKVADERGVDIMFSDSEGDSAKMIQLAEDYIAMGVDAVISTAPDQATSDSIKEICNAANVPFFLFDSSIEDYSGIAAYTTCDAELDGRNIAKWIKGYVDENLADKEFINVAAIDFFPSEICKVRTDACIAELEATIPNVKIVSHQDGNAARAESMSVMENILTAEGNDVDVAVSIAGWDATAGVKAAVEAAEASTIVIGVAWGEECCLALENADPTVQAVLLGLPSDMAKTVNAAYDYYNGGLDSPKIEYSYVMADHQTIFDLDWRAIKGIE